MKLVKSLGLLLTAVTFSATATAGTTCPQLMSEVGGYHGFKYAVDEAYEATSSFGFGLGMWATLMDTSGKVCAVYSVDGETASPNGGEDAGNTAWLGSRVISAQKATTANAFTLNGLSIPTGAIAATVYPGGSLYGLQHSNPVDTNVAYAGYSNRFGTKRDPMKNKRPGGVNVFGGGIALYNDSEKVGAVGVSGDTSCRDHAMAFQLRAVLALDATPNPDAIALVSEPAALFETPLCGVNDPDDAELYGLFIPVE